MKVTFLKSATVIVETGDVRILMDPWLVDGEYYGSWAHYPPFEWSDEILADIDYIYISHIHPDHLSPATMARLPKSIPVLIHRYDAKFLKRNIEAMGFEVREVPHNVRVPLGDKTTINILAADDCDPELCGKFLGCAALGGRLGSTQIDTLCVIDNGRHVLVNANDCPYPLAAPVAKKIRAAYQQVDMLMTGYAGAGPYPQCFENLTAQEKLAAAEAKKQSFLQHATRYIGALSPRYVLPFAGQYVLSGRLAPLDDFRGVPELEEAATYLRQNAGMDHDPVVLLNSGQHFDLETGRASAEYVPTDIDAKRAYREKVLAARRFSYEDDPDPSQSELESLSRAAFDRLSSKREEMRFTSKTIIYVELGEGHYARVPLDGGQFSVESHTGQAEPSIILRTPPRLLKRILSGPRYAHWNNATIGSHVAFERRPDVFERGTYHLMNFYHS